jgi:phospholipid transport system substrate-binding protein
MMARFTIHGFAVGVAATAGLFALPIAAHAAPSDPALTQIDAFQQTLLEAMKSGGTPQSRFTRLEPAVKSTFDLPAMARFAVGPTWTTIAATDQTAIVKAFSRMSVAQYARNFDSYSGQQFKLDPAVQARGAERLVKSELISPGSATPTTFVYRMRQASQAGQAGWKIIDVFYNGSVSQLTTMRADFAGSLKQGGADALVKKLNALSDKLLAANS